MTATQTLTASQPECVSPEPTRATMPDGAHWSVLSSACRNCGGFVYRSHASNPVTHLSSQSIWCNARALKS